MPLIVRRHFLSLEWVVGGRSWVLVSVGVSPSFSDGLARRPHNPLSWFLSLGGWHQSFRSFKNALASWPIPILGPVTSWKALRAQPLHFELGDLIIVKKSLESEALRAEVQGMLLLIRIWTGVQPCRHCQKMGWAMLATLPLPLFSPGGGRALSREGKALNKARTTCWAHLSISQHGDNKEKGWTLQLAAVSGRSGNCKNPSFVEFTATRCWAMDPTALSLSILSYKMGINDNSTYLLRCFVGIKWLNISKIFRIVPGLKYVPYTH